MRVGKEVGSNRIGETMTGYQSKKAAAQDKLDSMKDEALKLALEALEGVLDDAPKVLDASIAGGLYEVVQCRDALTAIKEALAQQPQRPWVGLTNEEVDQFHNWKDCTWSTNELVRHVEATLRSKNT